MFLEGARGLSHVAVHVMAIVSFSLNSISRAEIWIDALTLEALAII